LYGVEADRAGRGWHLQASYGTDRRQPASMLDSMLEAVFHTEESET